MIMIALGLTSAALSAYGGAQGYKGLSDRSQVKDIIKKLQNRHSTLMSRQDDLNARHQACMTKHKAFHKRVEDCVDRLMTLSDALDEEFNVVFNEREGTIHVSFSESDGADIKDNLGKTVFRTGRDMTGAALAGIAARQGALMAIRRFGVASTGMAIRGLTGAAAERAALAAAGEGALAIGGGGIAAGIAALNILAIGGTIAAGGQRFRKSQQNNLKQAQDERKRLTPEFNKADEQFDIFEARVAEAEQGVALIETRMAEVERHTNTLAAFADAGTLRAHINQLQMTLQDALVLASMICVVDD